MRKLSPLILILFLSCQPRASFLERIYLTDLQEVAINASQLENKIIILNLWATWCMPCVREMPDLEKMQAQLPDDFVLLLASNEELERIQHFKETRRFDLEFVHIKTSIESLGVYSLPTTFIIDKNGQVLDTIVGAQQWDSPQQIDYLKSYLR